MATKAPETQKRKVTDLVSRFEQLKDGDDLKKHCELLSEMEEQYRSKHVQALEKLSASDRDFATRLQREEEMQYQELVRRRNEQIELQERQLLEEESKVKSRLSDVNDLNQTLAQLEFSEFQELTPIVTVLAGKIGSKGFVDGVLASEARFSCPAGIAIVGDAVIVSDAGKQLLAFTQHIRQAHGFAMV